jgi:hypothetical protein
MCESGFFVGFFFWKFARHRIDAGNLPFLRGLSAKQPCFPLPLAAETNRGRRQSWEAKLPALVVA